MLSRRLVVVCVAWCYVAARQCIWGFPEWEDEIRAKGKGKGKSAGKGKDSGKGGWAAGSSGSTWKSW